jgi:hypothetical protein
MQQRKRNFPVRPILILFGIIFLGTYHSAAQNDTIVPIRKNAEEILRNLNLNSGGFNFWEDNFVGHWAGIDLGFNTFLNTDYSGYDSEFMKNNMIRSSTWNLNLLQQSIGLQRNRNNFGLVTGIGLEYQYYRLNDSTTIVRSENDAVVPKHFDYGENQRSKLFLFSATLPVLAEIQIPVNNYRNRIYFSAGMYFTYRIVSYTKITYRADKMHRLKITDNYALQNFKYGLMFRTGYRWINFYAKYELTPFFKEDKGPELTPFTVGVTLLRF